MRPDAATLRLAVLPRAGLLADAVLVAAGAGLVALAAQVSIPLPFTPVPITGQTFAVLLVGGALGAVRALASLVLYVGVGLLGAPVYADGNHGWEILRGATGGYLVGVVVAAVLRGVLAQRRVGPPFSLLGRGDAVRKRRHLPRRRPVARRRREHRAREDARARPVSVRRR